MSIKDKKIFKESMNRFKGSQEEKRNITTAKKKLSFSLENSVTYKYYIAINICFDCMSAYRRNTDAISHQKSQHKNCQNLTHLTETVTSIENPG